MNKKRSTFPRSATEGGIIHVAELRKRLLGAKIDVSGIPMLKTFVATQLWFQREAQLIKALTPLNRRRNSPALWPCDEMFRVATAVRRPDKEDPQKIIDFFNNVAGLQFLAEGKRSPAWATQSPSIVTATVAMMAKRAATLKGLPRFNGRSALCEVEIWLGWRLFLVSCDIRNELAAALRSKSVAFACSSCHRLSENSHKYCSDGCMQAANDAKKARRTYRPVAE